jgi:hypothetical protein
MDIGLIISIVLQIGLGSALVIAVRKRKKKNYAERHPILWKIGMYATLILGWLMIVLSIGYLLIHVILFLLSR